jgi:hypothetical protein
MMKQNDYTLDNLEPHWQSNINEFKKNYQDWISLLNAVLALFSESFKALKKDEKTIENNFAFLILSKSLNHSLSAYKLIQSGLFIDAALCARNALETILLLDYFSLDSTTNHFKEWYNGKEYKPYDVRKALKNMNSVKKREVIIELDSSDFEDYEFAYKWFSQITHANYNSMNYIVEKEKGTKNNYMVFIGGSLKNKSAFITAVFNVIINGLIDNIVYYFSIYNLKFFEEIKERIKELLLTLKELMANQKKHRNRN